jgi:hypothetical protein
MPVLDPKTSSGGFAIASSAAMFALLDSVLAKGVLDRTEIQSVIKTAMLGVGGRVQFASLESTEAREVLQSLWDRFSKS